MTKNKGRVSEKNSRKLAAIMFTDIVGFTALNQSNENQALEVLEKHNQFLRTIFPKYEGREVKAIGDSFLVEFDSALDATFCAIEIQKFLHDYSISSSDHWKIKLRIGIHVGDVVHKGKDILGDAVNIASRIEPLADPEGICISQQVFDQVHNKIDYPLVELEAPVLKNVVFPTSVFSVILPWEKPKDTYQHGRAKSRLELDVHRIAVLPFSNMSPDPNDEYFSDGMTEEVISAISKVPDLSVISRTSVMPFKTQTKDVSEISTKLNVGTLLEGSVRKAGNRVRIAVQLIDANSDKHLWAENYDRTFEDIFEIQSDIAQRIAKALKIHLWKVHKVRIERAPTQNARAYDLYLKGLSQMHLGTEEEYMAAISYFERAIEYDSKYASAYVQIAFAYNFLGFFEMMPMKQALAKAERMTRKALKIDGSLAEAHLSMAVVLRNKWSFPGAVEEAYRALELNPNLAEAHNFLAYTYQWSWQSDKALVEMGTALELDPQSVAIMQFAGSLHLYDGQLDKAIEFYKKVLEREPTAEHSQGNLGLCYVKKGMYDEGIAQIKKSIEMSKSFKPPGQSDLVYALAKAGRVEEAQKVIRGLTKFYEDHQTGAVSLASAYASVGEKEKALEWLETAYKENSAYLLGISVDFGFEDMHSDPRFLSFLKKMKLIT